MNCTWKTRVLILKIGPSKYPWKWNVGKLMGVGVSRKLIPRRNPSSLRDLPLRVYGPSRGTRLVGQKWTVRNFEYQCTSCTPC